MIMLKYWEAVLLPWMEVAREETHIHKPLPFQLTCPWLRDSATPCPREPGHIVDELEDPFQAGF